MITTEQVKAAMQRWECAGLVPTAAPQKLVEGFIERFSYMDEATLEYVTAKVILGDSWPRFNVVEQLAQEFESKNARFLHIDYFKEMRLKAFGEKEGFQEFIQRIAEKYFPGRGQEWLDKYSFTLYYYGVVCAACSKCEGKCPRNGHRLHLRIKRGSSCPVPWGSLELCEKFKASVDGTGRVRRKCKTVTEQAMSKEAEQEAALAAMTDIDVAAILVEENAVEQRKRRPKVEQLLMFGEGGEAGGYAETGATT